MEGNRLSSVTQGGNITTYAYDIMRRESMTEKERKDREMVVQFSIITKTDWYENAEKAIEIMEKRLEEMRNMIVQYGGQEKLEELRTQVQAIKFQFSEQEIGKATINVATENKDKAQIQVQKDEQLLPKEQDSQQSID